MSSALRAGVVALVVLGGCGTTYKVPDVDERVEAEATAMFAAAQDESSISKLGRSQAEARFRRVAARIEPVAENFCRQELASRSNADCDVRLSIDYEMAQRNAYFTYLGAGNTEPTIFFTLPLLQDTRNDDEVAFVMGHEYGHRIARHIEKGQQQAATGAILLGTIAAMGNAAAAANGQYYDPNAVENSVALGYALGGRAFSQTYELESDTIGTYIALEAGYDPAVGAKFFARDEDARSGDGKLSFWGTHPPDQRRVAVVLATQKHLAAGGSLEHRSENTQAP